MKLPLPHSRSRQRESPFRGNPHQPLVCAAMPEAPHVGTRTRSRRSPPRRWAPGASGTTTESPSLASASLVLLSALVSFRRDPATVSRSSFPPAVLCSDVPFAPPGPFEQVPRSHRYYETIRLLPTVPLPFLSMRQSTSCLGVWFAPRSCPPRSLAAARPGPFIVGPTRCLQRGGEASQVPGQLLRTCPAHRPR